MFDVSNLMTHRNDSYLTSLTYCNWFFIFLTSRSKTLLCLVLTPPESDELELLAGKFDLSENMILKIHADLLPLKPTKSRKVNPIHIRIKSPRWLKMINWWKLEENTIIMRNTSIIKLVLTLSSNIYMYHVTFMRHFYLLSPFTTEFTARRL